MKRLKRLFCRRRNNGFTLVEMIVSLALLAILMGGVMLFMLPIIRSFDDTNRSYTAENAATAVEEYIVRSIRNANQVAIFNYIAPGDLTTDANISAQITKMNTYCKNINGTAPSGSEKYLLKCISLRYDSTSGKYYLCNEQVNMNAGGVLTDPTAITDTKKVFSDCLYNNMYMTFDISQINNADYNNPESTTKGDQYRTDTLSLEVCAYTDPERLNGDLVFKGSGIAELRQIKVMVKQDEKNKDSYYMMMQHPSNPDTQYTYADADADKRDIFIYYVVRRLGTATTTP